MKDDIDKLVDDLLDAVDRRADEISPERDPEAFIKKLPAMVKGYVKTSREVIKNLKDPNNRTMSDKQIEESIEALDGVLLMYLEYSINSRKERV